MIASFDCETRGLWGSIFLCGYYDEISGYHSFKNAEEFMKHLYMIEENLPEITEIVKEKEVKKKDMLYVYAFNLEFDLSKILSEFTKKKLKLLIDYNNTLIISGKMHTVKILDKNIVFCDILPLVDTNLDDAAKTFNLDVKKIDLGNIDKEKYFKTISPDDPDLQNYLRHDVIATYELTKKIMALSQLPEAAFVRCPTIASLAMRIFKNRMADDFAKIKVSELRKAEEEFVRGAYHGGRVEVYKNIAEDCYHYDINSLYPSAMMNNLYPTGHCYFSKKKGDKMGGRYGRQGLHVTKESLLEYIQSLNKMGFLYIADCLVKIPCTVNFGLLPMKREGKLIFPAGTFRGSWTSPELNFALENGAELLEVFQCIHWEKKDKVFTKFVETFKTIKETSTGALRHFAKKVQNSLYGKLATRRERLVYELYSDEKRERLDAKKSLNAKILSQMGQDIIVYHKLFFADYIRPQFSTFVTAYSRIELLRTMLQVEQAGGKVYYCDTDSIVTDIPLPSSLVSENSYGLWKLERNVKKGIYILPKLYAELSDGGEEVLKSKGIIREYRETMQFDTYAGFFKKMVKRENVTLYDQNSEPPHYGRTRIIQVEKLMGKRDYEHKTILKKRFLFSNIYIHKRMPDFENNSSRPVILNETEAS